VDASVMPTLPRGDIGAAVVAIAERAADLIAGRAPLVPADPELVPAPAQPAHSGSGHSGSGPRSAAAADHGSVWSEGCGLGACRFA
jgi:hypothetical protein